MNDSIKGIRPEKLQEFLKRRDTIRQLSDEEFERHFRVASGWQEKFDSTSEPQERKALETQLEKTLRFPREFLLMLLASEDDPILF